MNTKSILIIDDFTITRTTLKIRIKHAFENKVDVEVAADLEKGLQLIKDKKYTHVVSDLRMPGSDVYEVVNVINALFNENQRTFISTNDIEGMQHIQGLILKDSDYITTLINRLKNCI